MKTFAWQLALATPPDISILSQTTDFRQHLVSNACRQLTSLKCKNASDLPFSQRTELVKTCTLIYSIPVCPRGSFKNEQNGGTCELCPENTFSTTEDATSCTPCPVGTNTDSQAGQESSSACGEPNFFFGLKGEGIRSRTWSRTIESYGSAEMFCRMQTV